MKLNLHSPRPLVAALIVTLLATPLAGVATDEDCYLERQNHFGVSVSYPLHTPNGERAAGPGYNASIADGQACWLGVSHETIDTRIIPRGADRILIQYSPYGPGGPEDYGLATACFAGPVLLLTIDGMGWHNETIDMNCYPRLYQLDWTNTPTAPITPGILTLSVTDHLGHTDTTVFRIV